MPAARLVYEPEMARQVLASYMSQAGKEGSGVALIKGTVVSADSAKRAFVVRTPEGETVEIKAKVIIDATPELDLARKFGVSYRIGKDNTVYNDLAGNTPAAPSAGNDFRTAPQAMSILPTFAWKNSPPPIAEFPGYDAGSYDPNEVSKVADVSGFPYSWSNIIAALPNGKHEFNEFATDWRDPQDAFDWVMSPEKRPEITARVRNWGISQLRYLQENGYTNLTLVAAGDWPYFRGEVTIANGRDRLTAGQVGKAVPQPAAFSYYSQYDRHEALGNENSTNVHYGRARVWVPWRAMMPQEFDWLLVSEGACCDYVAYNSAFRTEPLRMNLGGAAGAVAALSISLGKAPAALDYARVREALGFLHYRFAPADHWTDISDAQWVQVYGVTAAQVATVAEGYSDGTFRPTALVTRAQFAKMALYGFQVQPANPDKPSFKDVPKTHPFFAWVEGAVRAKIVTGYTNGTFQPSRNIARQQALSMVGRYVANKELRTSGGIRGAKGVYPTVDAWFRAEGRQLLTPFADARLVAAVHQPYVAYLLFHKIVQGETTSTGKYLSPNKYITRAQTAVLIVRAR
ncbi:MAG: FAD-dependent oxidoreductase [Thermoleophilia bacterium]|nr:FAD-dependent oxidoreductase [Thermoleophilia bacterium]